MPRASRLRDLFASHPKIQPQSSKVNFTAFGSSAMEIEITAELKNDGADMSATREICC